MECELRGATTRDIENFRDSLLDVRNPNFLPDVSFRAGTIFSNVVLACLGGLSDPAETAPLTNDLLQDAYVSRVV